VTDLFDFKAKPSNYGVMGNPVKHSKSPEIHNMFASQCNIPMQYDRIQVDSGGFDQAVSHFSAHGGAGLNVTVPYKVEAWKMCQSEHNAISQRADLAEAVNTLTFEKDGSVSGDNTDGAGLVTDLENNIGVKLANLRILVIGAGGAVRGVLGPLLDRAPGAISIANRTVSKASTLVDRFSDQVEINSATLIQACALSDIPDQPYDLIINGTAASLEGNLPGINPACLGPHTTVYDMMYSLQPTIFMSWALSCGADRAHDGLGMLVEQAAESFFIWHGQRPLTTPVIQALRKI
jgi:shikimate dehydrogenase